MVVHIKTGQTMRCSADMELAAAAKRQRCRSGRTTRLPSIRVQRACTAAAAAAAAAAASECPSAATRGDPSRMHAYAHCARVCARTSECWNGPALVALGVDARRPVRILRRQADVEQILCEHRTEGNARVQGGSKGMSRCDMADCAWRVAAAATVDRRLHSPRRPLPLLESALPRDRPPDTSAVFLPLPPLALPRAVPRCC